MRFSARNENHPPVVDDAPAVLRTSVLLAVERLARDTSRFWTWEGVRNAVAAGQGKRGGDLAGLHPSQQTATALMTCEWPEFFNSLEALIEELDAEWRDSAEEVGWHYDFEAVRRSFIDALERALRRANSGYMLHEGCFVRAGSAHYIRATADAYRVLADPRLGDARSHFSQATKAFGSRDRSLLPTAVHQACLALEAAAKALFPEIKAATYHDVCTKLFKRYPAVGEQLGEGAKKIMEGIWALRNSAPGVAHAGTNQPKVNEKTAEFALSVISAQIVLLHRIAAQVHDEDDLPF